jgi:hypothetical protein
MKSIRNKNHSLSRRSFIGNCSACAAGTLLLPYIPLRTFNQSGSGPKLPQQKAKVRIIYGYPDPDQPNWPNIHYDFNGHIKEISRILENGCPDIDLISYTTMVGTEDEGKKILAMDQDVDGYIVYLAGCLWGNLTETITSSGKPTIIADNLFAGSGEFLTSYAWARREGHKVLAVSSSDYQDLIDAVNCFTCLKKLKNSKILVVGANTE